MHLVLRSETQSIAKAVRFAEDAANEAGFPEETGDRMVLSVGEAVANSIEHGNSTNKDLEICLSWVTEGKGGWLGIEDEGPGITEDDVHSAQLPGDLLQTGGRGLYIIRKLSDGFKVEKGGRLLLLRFTPRDVQAQ